MSSLPASLAQKRPPAKEAQVSEVSNELIPLSRVTALVKLFATRNYSVKALLSGTEISHLTLSQTRASVSLEQFKRLIENAYLLSSDYSFAAQLGEQSFINNGNLLTSRVMHSETVEEAIALIIRYQSLLSDVMTLKTKKTQGGTLLQITANEALATCLPFFVEHTFAQVYAMGKYCLDESDPSLRHDFSYPRPSNSKYFSQYFASNMRFDQACNQVFLPDDLLRKELLFSDPFLAAQRETQCQNRIREINSKHDVLYKVRQVFKHQALNSLSHERLAELLCVSPRTLRRQLSARGSSYSELLEKERKKLAIKSMAKKTTSLDQLAESLGYRDQSSFSRAFKRWFGVSPKHYTNKVSLPED